ncbi:triokinase/FMN cyclase-like isoform X3 [Lycorma delicatula]|uniref:triokinase/FMN cyclase-like isoform X3 n=1 Tax=Lycorma delicatula TaxID=130591 RepID=UPI003F50F007
MAENSCYLIDNEVARLLDDLASDFDFCDVEHYDIVTLDEMDGEDEFGSIMHNGYIGRGMVHGTVLGNIFTSPPAKNCLTIVQNVAQHFQGGVLVLIPNYTGDVLSFSQAIETARDLGINVEYIAVGEDCALLDNVDETISTVGRRGLVGQLFIFKIAGAMSNNGASLSSMLDTCKNVLANMATLGVCTSPCTLPGATQPLFKLDPNHYELGLGNHGEAGVAKINICSADELVKAMLEKIIKTLSVKSGDEVCIIVNNLGASSQMESFIVAGECSKQLKNAGIAVARLYVGTLVTSLDMGGVQISLLKTTGQPNWLKLLDAETEAFAWPGRVTSYEKCPVKITETVTLLKKLTGPELPPHEADVLKNCLQAIAYSLKSSETKLNLLDSGCGDGDCGTTLRNLADGILKSLNSLPVNKPQSCFLELAQIASETMGGTSGGIYSLMLRGASRNVPDWTAAWKEALETVKKYSPAREGCRTMMDALIPAYNTYEKQIHSESWQTALASAVKKAEEGCESTRNMEAKCGRASYVNKTYLKDVDAGAFGVTIWLQALFKELCQK